MTHVIKISFGKEGKYYVRVHEDKWDEVYNPKFATPFESKEAAKDWILQNGGHLEESMTPVQQKGAVKSYGEWESKGTVRRTFPPLAQNKYNIEYDPQKHDKWFVLEWHLNHSEMSYRIYKTWPYLFSIFSHIHEVTRYIDYEDAGKSFNTLTLSTPRDGVFETFESELKEAMERFSFNYRARNGNLIFELFTHELSEFGTVYLWQIGDPSKDRWGVSKSRSTSSYYPKFEGSLEETFEYIRKNHYYDN